MFGKTCIITGANSGIGFETAKALASQGARLLLVCRNESKGWDAIESIRSATGNSKIELYTADLASQQNIRTLAADIRAAYPRIDVLVNNAGTWISRHTLTEDGIETVFAVNHLATFLLTHLLYPNLREAEEARIVNVSSDSHFQTGLHFEDLNLTKNYNGLRSYAQSKLANVMFTYELDRRKPESYISVNAVQPGLVHTDIGLKDTNWLHGLAWKVRRSFWKSFTPVEGAKTSIFLASAPEIGQESGKYWDNCIPKTTSKASYIETDASRLWEMSLEMCGLRSFFGEGQ